MILAEYDGIVYTFNGSNPSMGPPINSFKKTRTDGVGCSAGNACEVIIRVEKSAVLKVKAYKWNSETNGGAGGYDYSGETSIDITIEGTIKTPTVDVDGSGNGSGTYDNSDLDGEGYLNISVTIPKGAQGIVYTKNHTEPNIYKSSSSYVIRDYIITCAGKSNDSNTQETYAASPNPVESTCSADKMVKIRVKSSTLIKVKAYAWNSGSNDFDYSDTTIIDAEIEGTVPAPEVAIPDPNNADGRYIGCKIITLTIPVGSVGIIYTVNGSNPSMGNEGNGGDNPSNGVFVSGNPGDTITINVDSSCDLTVVAVEDNGDGTYDYSESTETEVIIEGTVFVPSFNPVPGHYTQVQNIVLSSSNAESIRYTIGDGTQAAPANCSSGLLYSGAIRVEERKTIKAIACASGLTQSMSSVGTYNVSAPTVQNITVSFSPGLNSNTETYTQAQTLTLGTGTSGATIYYTTDGSTPTCSGNSGTTVSIVAGAYPNANTKTVKAIACKTGYKNSSVFSQSVSVYNRLAKPSFDGSGDQPGTYTKTSKPANIKLSSSESGVSIHYTSNGNTPTCSDTQYSNAFGIDGTSTIQAVACKSGWAVSEVLSGTFEVTGTIVTPSFSPEGATYSSSQSVAISTSTTDTTIYYTTDGSTPAIPASCSADATLPTKKYTGAITVSSSQVIKAIACRTGWDNSALSSSTYLMSLAAPSGLNANGSTTAVNVSWTAVAGADKYAVYRSTASDSGFEKVAEPSSNSYSDTAVSVGVFYYYKVKTISSFNSQIIEGQLGSVAAGWMKLSAPQNLSVSQGSNSSKVILSWNAVSGAESYDVFRDGSYLKTVATNSAEDTTAVAGNSYSYKVMAKSSSPSSQSAYSSTVNGWLKLTKPSNLTASSGTYTDKVALNWDAVSGAESYKVYRNGSLLTTVSGNSYNDSAASGATTYSYAVVAVDTNPASESVASDSADGYKKLSVPSTVAASNGTSTASIQVTWANVSGANTYDVYRSSDSYSTIVCSGSNGTTGCTDTTAVAGTLYVYKVKAKNTADAKYTSVLSSNSDTGFRQLSTPSSVTAIESTAGGETKVTVTWTAAGSYDKAIICSSMEENGDYVCDQVETGTNPTEFVAQSAFSGVAYYYKVQIVNTESGAVSEVSNNTAAATRVGGYAELSAGADNFSTSTSGVRYTSIAFYNGVPYVAYLNPSDSKIYAYRYNTAKDVDNNIIGWEPMGSSGLVGGSADTYPMTTIKIYDEDNIYVSYTNNSQKIVVSKFSKSGDSWTGGSWSSLGLEGKAEVTGKTSYHYQTMSLDSSGNPYIAFVNSSNSVEIWKYDGSSWSQVGSDIAAYMAFGGSYLALYISGTTPYVIYKNTSNELQCKKYDGSWTNFGVAIGNGSYPKLYVDNSNVYVAYSDLMTTSLHVVSLPLSANGSDAWTDDNRGTAASGSDISRKDMKIIDGKIYIGYQAGNTGYVKMYNGSNWITVGGNNSPDFDNGIIGSMPSDQTKSSISIDFAYGKVFAAFTDSTHTGNITVKY